LGDFRVHRFAFNRDRTFSSTESISRIERRPTRFSKPRRSCPRL
jgi:hypothetical protein